MESETIFIDTHAHLNFSHFKENYQEVIRRARAAGVRAIINVGAQIGSTKSAIKIASEYEKGMYATCAVHPIHADENFTKEELEKLAEDRKVVAIGETGLDYYRIKVLKNVQKKVLFDHIELAKKIKKPLIFHCREAKNDFLDVISQYQDDFKSGRLKGVMHCFPGGWDFAREVLDLGMMISYTGLITFTKDINQIEAVKKIPLEKLMIETDCPFMTPTPFRGKTNEPKYIIEIAKKIAELKKISLEKVADQTTKNAIEFFGIELMD